MDLKNLVDIGCNLTHDSFDADRESVLDAAIAAGVAQLVITGASPESNPQALELARSRPGQLFATAGLHPHHASQWSADLESEIRELLQAPEVVAVGECGLDYFRDLSPRNDQRRAFEALLQVAVDTGLPMFLHLREAHEDFHSMLKAARDRLTGVVVHCFTGSRPELFDYLDLDCHIGITGWICDERRGTQMRDYLHNIPPERLMVETDAPYLKPRNLRPRVKSHRNEPRWLPWIVQELASARGEPAEVLAATTTATARTFFRLPE